MKRKKDQVDFFSTLNLIAPLFFIGLRTCSKSRCDEPEMADSRASHRSVSQTYVRSEAQGIRHFWLIAGRDFEQVLRLSFSWCDTRCS
ncbi:MAG: hypothetical protein A2887_02475 [Alphaproteobacteria bacterium RIFCSPLOWO2_01_FULL_40_26]|nr:MAG: hypothetical protein A2887_02475 [Alphaproteobacteria bacterium RIFCSPLOWO2_01_FULL_40_26]OFX10477.1 MAG: hypothetical protein A3H30_03885 [Alphaproteobacteria bacterium RIFCSPLOWO2_02_FULL_40_19]